jgi:ABC-2 type transport system permease protein
MRLLGVELGRYASRRAVAVTLLVALALGALLVASAAWSTRPADATERAAAERLLAENRDAGEADLEACLAAPEEYLGPGATAAACETIRPQLDWFLPRDALSIEQELEDRGTVFLMLLAAVGILVGSTFAGADWASGSMSTQLLFVPRRLRVWAAKAVAVVVATAAATALLLAASWGALALVAAGRGITTPDETWLDVVRTSGRGVALVAAVTLGGFALTMLLRHTVGTLGLLFGYAVVGEGLAASLPFERMTQWSMANNVLAWLHDGTRVHDDSACDVGAAGCSGWYTLSLGHAAAYLGGLLLLAVVVSLVAFRRRDVP